ncbi:hypothetical protein GWI33_018046 [Rhynchophorus ferrugineus]|uniref:Uncharacterized protein n=1 Tax=Rhynchophorus ferrugineus TaxID=354439 RepID=A0A834HWX4_RHYFE|nr:hypothetical protein GWI33_018046 [Rhynchophorus ferrugineus]
MDRCAARDELQSALSEIKSLIEFKVRENNGAGEYLLESTELKSLAELKAELSNAMDLSKRLESEKTHAEKDLVEYKKSSKEKLRILARELEKLEERFKNMEEQNSHLWDQIRQLNAQLNISQAHDTADTEQLRHEKCIAVNRANIIEGEYLRLKSQFDAVTETLKETKSQMEAEKHKTEVSMVPAAKHEEILRNLNAATDSNTILMQERDYLFGQVMTLQVCVENLEAEITPLEEKNRDLTTKMDLVYTENIRLKQESTRWKGLVNRLVEEINRTSEDWKKSFAVEQEKIVKLSDGNNALTKNIPKLEPLNTQNGDQNEEIRSLKEQVAAVQNELKKLTERFVQRDKDNKASTVKVNSTVRSDNKRLASIKESSDRTCDNSVNKTQGYNARKNSFSKPTPNTSVLHISPPKSSPRIVVDAEKKETKDNFLPKKKDTGSDQNPSEMPGPKQKKTENNKSGTGQRRRKTWASSGTPQFLY